MQRNDDVSASKSAKRNANTGRLMLKCLIAGALAGGLAGVVGSLTPVPEPIVNASALLVMGGLAIWWCRDWWINVDEGVREAHKFGWFWGGSAGMIVAGAVGIGLQAIGNGPAAQFGIEPRDADLIFTGMMLAIGMLLVGYGICWAGWWIARR